MKILLENLGEASSQPSAMQSTQETVRARKDVLSGPDHLKGIDEDFYYDYGEILALMPYLYLVFFSCLV